MDQKWFLMSKTLWGAFIAIMPVLLPALGVSFDASQIALVSEAGDKWIMAGGALLVALDRLFSSHTQLAPLPPKIWPRSRR